MLKIKQRLVKFIKEHIFEVKFIISLIALSLWIFLMYLIVTMPV